MDVDEYTSKLLKFDTVVLAALISRNNVAHEYNEAIALDIVEQTKKHYVDMFEALKENIEKNWDITKILDSNKLRYGHQTAARLSFSFTKINIYR